MLTLENHMTYIFKYVLHLEKNKNIKKIDEEFRNIIDIVVFIYEKDIKTIYKIFQKHTEWNISCFKETTNKVSNAKKDFDTHNYITARLIIKKFIELIQIEEYQNDVNSKNHRQSMVKTTYEFKEIYLKGKNYKKNEKKRMRKNEKRKIKNKNELDILDNTEVVENFESESDIYIGESEAKNTMHDDSCNSFNEKLQKKNEFINIVDKSTEEIQEINNDKNIEYNDLQQETDEVDKKNLKYNLIDSNACSIKLKNQLLQGCKYRIKNDKKNDGNQQKRDAKKNEDMFNSIYMDITHNFTKNCYLKSHFSQDPKNYAKIEEKNENKSKYKGPLELLKNDKQHQCKRIKKYEFPKHEKIRLDTDKTEEDYHSQYDEMSSGRVDEHSHSTKKIIVKNENLLDHEKKYSSKCSDEHKQEIPLNLPMEKKSFDIFNDENIKYNEESEVD